jgi:hypothetical protein
VAQCADTTNEYLLVGSHILVPWGTVVRVVGDPEEASGRLGTVTGHTGHVVDFEPVQRLTFQGGTDLLRADPGEYTLDLFARWSGGDAALAFGIGITKTG